MSLVNILLFSFVIIAVLLVYFLVHAPQHEAYIHHCAHHKTDDVDEILMESYAPCSTGEYENVNDCCGCNRLSSDLSNSCRPECNSRQGRSQCRYPIDLPKPDEPPVSDECYLSGACGDGACLSALKYNLQ